MSKQVSFSKYENKILPSFRQKINHAESTEDVKKFFVYTAQALLGDIFKGRIDFEYEDFKLMPESKSHFSVSKRLLTQDSFSSIWNDSDLPRVVSRLAETSMKRYRHIEKNPGKTESKIRMPG